jgi:hypothetical protein
MTRLRLMLARVFVFASSAHLLYRIDDKAQVDACKAKHSAGSASSFTNSTNNTSASAFMRIEK